MREAIISALIGAVVALLGTWITADVRGREIDLQYTQLAIGILREDPAELNIPAVRNWAVDLLNETSPIKLDESAREELVNKSLRLAVGGGFFGLPIVYEAMQTTIGAEGANADAFELDGVTNFTDVE